MGDELMVGAAFSQFFDTAMKIAQYRGGFNQAFAFQFQDDL
jgi:hypothetical protein